MKTLKALIILLAICSSLTLKAQNAEVNTAFNKVIGSYLSLKNALAANDGNAAESKAKELVAALNEVPKQKLSSSEASFYAKYEPKLEYDSRHISEVNHIAHQREHFASLSNNLYAVLKPFKLNHETLYRQYCTGEKQYYLTDNDKAKDPYMGMTGCYKTTETLPAVH